MTSTSRIINASISIVSQIVGYGGAVVAVGFMTAVGCWSEFKAAWNDSFGPDPEPMPEPQTRPHLTLVVIDRDERTAENDQRWN